MNSGFTNSNYTGINIEYLKVIMTHLQNIVGGLEKK